MRRAAGLTLTALGAFLVTLAALLRLWVPGQVIKFPLNEYSVTTLTGTGLTYFNSSSLQDFRDTRATEIITIEGNVSAGSPSTAVWSSFTGFVSAALVYCLPSCSTATASDFNPCGFCKRRWTGVS